MASRWAAVAAGIFLAWGGIAAAQAPADNKAEIERLIQQLGSADEATRSAAQARLAAMGDEARAALEAHVRARTAAEMALQMMDTNKAAAPTLITLNVSEAPVEQVLTELSKQAGFEVVLGNPSMGGPLSPVTIAADKQPFWNVLREVGTKAGLTLYNTGYGGPRLSLAPAGPMGNLLRHPAHVQGAFMVAVGSVQRTNTADLVSSPPAITRVVTLNLQVCAEPKVRVISTRPNADLEEAVDENGNSLLPKGGPMQSSSMGHGGGQWSLSLRLAYPDNAGQRIARLRGKTRCTVQTRSQVTEVAKILQAGETPIAANGRKIVFKELKKSSDRHYTATVYAERVPEGSGSSYEPMQGVRLKLVDEQTGQEWTSTGGFSGITSSATGVEYKVSLYRQGMDNGQAAEPTKMVCDVTVATQEIVLPFEFKDLPLP